MPIKENYPSNPVSPYAISKKFQKEIGFYYLTTYGLNIYFTRTFHIMGLGQPLGFVCSDIAQQIVDVENGKIKNIKIGNLDAKRDFLDVRDVVEAYWEIINQGQVGEIYNVCRGKSIAIREILDKLVKLSRKKISVTVDKDRLRPSDVPDFVGDNKKLRDISWMPQYTIDDSLNTLLEGRRNETKRAKN